MTLKFRPFAMLVVVLLFTACDSDDNKDITPLGSVKIEGKEYLTAVVGTQTWTSVNYSGPGGVPFDEADTKPEYGKYYSRVELAAITLPEGWRIPTQEDYTKLAKFCAITLPSQGTETDKVKSLISQTNWNNVLGTNTSRFNAQPGGYIFGASAPVDGDIAEFWTNEGVTFSIQEAGEGLTKLRAVFYQSGDHPEYKFNVRFVKD